MRQKDEATELSKRNKGFKDIKKNKHKVQGRKIKSKQESYLSL